VRVPTGAAHLGAALGLDGYAEAAQQILDSASAGSPQQAATRLVEAVRASHAGDLAEMVDPTLAEELTGSSSPTPEQLCAVMRSRLHDVLTTEGWGFGSARRLQSPDVELIKLVRTGSNDPVLVTSPRLLPAHLFFLALVGPTWVLTGLDSPDPALDQPS